MSLQRWVAGVLVVVLLVALAIGGAGAESALTAEALAELAREAYRAGDLVTAIDYYSQALVLEPNNAKYRKNRGNAYLEIEDAKMAVLDLGLANEHAPDDTETLSNLASALVLLGDYDTAINELTHAIEVNPTLGILYCNRGFAYYELVRFEEALADFAMAIKLEPWIAQNYINRASVYQHLEQYVEAFADYQMVQTLVPEGDSMIIFLLSSLQHAAMEAQRRAQESPEAQTVYERFVQNRIARGDETTSVPMEYIAGDQESPPTYQPIEAAELQIVSPIDVFFGEIGYLLSVKDEVNSEEIAGILEDFMLAVEENAPVDKAQEAAKLLLDGARSNNDDPTKYAYRYITWGQHFVSYFEFPDLTPWGVMMVYKVPSITDLFVEDDDLTTRFSHADIDRARQRFMALVRASGEVLFQDVPLPEIDGDKTYYTPVDGFDWIERYDGEIFKGITVAIHKESSVYAYYDQIVHAAVRTFDTSLILPQMLGIANRLIGNLQVADSEKIRGVVNNNVKYSLQTAGDWIALYLEPGTP